MISLSKEIESRVIFNGIQEGVPGTPDQIVLTDRKTMSTFFIPVLEGKELEKTVLENVARIRDKFKESQLERKN